MSEIIAEFNADRLRYTNDKGEPVKMVDVTIKRVHEKDGTISELVRGTVNGKVRYLKFTNVQMVSMKIT